MTRQPSVSRSRVRLNEQEWTVLGLGFVLYLLPNVLFTGTLNLLFVRFSSPAPLPLPTLHLHGVTLALGALPTLAFALLLLWVIVRASHRVRAGR